MHPLRAADQAAFLDFLRRLYEPCELADFRARVVTSIQTLVPADVVCYDEVDLLTQTDTWFVHPADALTFPDSHHIFTEHLSEHPVIGYHAHNHDAPVLKLSDFLSQRQLRDLGLYQDFFKRVGTEYQISCLVASDRPFLVGLVLNRPDRDFTERERAVLCLASPHLIQAHSAAKTVSSMKHELESFRAVIERLEDAIVVLWPDGTLRSCSPRAERWLRSRFGDWSPANALPPALREWVRLQQARLQNLQPVEPFSLELENDPRLIVRFCPSEACSILILSEEPDGLSAVALRSLGLSSRETEVLSLVAEGRSNEEVATLLTMSRRTVQKHLEHIFQKLGVDTRTAAARRAWELASTPKST
jgi:DNA-binding CsgD family transcriptional regulator